MSEVQRHLAAATHSFSPVWLQLQILANPPGRWMEKVQQLSC